MAKGIAICNCKICNGTFKKEAYKFNRAEADSWAAWATEHYDICPDCWKKAEEEKAAAAAKERQLPELAGSEKQIAWATKIREKFMAQFDENAAKTNLPELAEKTKKWLYTKNESRFWIDSRDLTFRGLLAKNREEIMQM